jgi:hypothetical protein
LATVVATRFTRSTGACIVCIVDFSFSPVAVTAERTPLIALVAVRLVALLAALFVALRLAGLRRTFLAVVFAAAARVALRRRAPAVGRELFRAGRDALLVPARLLAPLLAPERRDRDDPPRDFVIVAM